VLLAKQRSDAAPQTRLRKVDRELGMILGVDFPSFVTRGAFPLNNELHCNFRG